MRSPTGRLDPPGLSIDAAIYAIASENGAEQFPAEPGALSRTGGWATGGAYALAYEVQPDGHVRFEGRSGQELPPIK